MGTWSVNVGSGILPCAPDCRCGCCQCAITVSIYIPTQYVRSDASVSVSPEDCSDEPDGGSYTVESGTLLPHSTTFCYSRDGEEAPGAVVITAPTTLSLSSSETGGTVETYYFDYWLGYGDNVRFAGWDDNEYSPGNAPWCWYSNTATVEFPESGGCDSTLRAHYRSAYTTTMDCDCCSCYIDNQNTDAGCPCATVRQTFSPCSDYGRCD